MYVCVVGVLTMQISTSVLALCRDVTRWQTASTLSVVSSANANRDTSVTDRSVKVGLHGENCTLLFPIWQVSKRWLGGSVVERRSLIGELSLVCTGPAADG